MSETDVPDPNAPGPDQTDVTDPEEYGSLTVEDPDGPEDEDDKAEASDETSDS